MQSSNCLTSGYRNVFDSLNELSAYIRSHKPDYWLKQVVDQQCNQQKANQKLTVFLSHAHKGMVNIYDQGQSKQVSQHYPNSFLKTMIQHIDLYKRGGLIARLTQQLRKADIPIKNISVETDGQAASNELISISIKSINNKNVKLSMYGVMVDSDGVEFALSCMKALGFQAIDVSYLDPQQQVQAKAFAATNKMNIITTLINPVKCIRSE